MSIYLKHFGLVREPFSIVPDPGFLYPSNHHRQAVAHLKYGLDREGGFILLTMRKGLFNRAVLEFVDADRKALERSLSDKESFVQDYVLSPALLDQLVALGEAEDIPFVEEDWNTSLPAITLRLKAILGRNMFDTATFYEVFNPINPVYQRGIEVLKDGTYKDSGIGNR